MTPTIGRQAGEKLEKMERLVVERDGRRRRYRRVKPLRRGSGQMEMFDCTQAGDARTGGSLEHLTIVVERPQSNQTTNISGRAHLSPRKLWHKVKKMSSDPGPDLLQGRAALRFFLNQILTLIQKQVSAAWAVAAL